MIDVQKRNEPGNASRERERQRKKRKRKKGKKRGGASVLIISTNSKETADQLKEKNGDGARHFLMGKQRERARRTLICQLILRNCEPDQFPGGQQHLPRPHGMNTTDLVGFVTNRGPMTKTDL